MILDNLYPSQRVAEMLLSKLRLFITRPLKHKKKTIFMDNLFFALNNQPIVFLMTLRWQTYCCQTNVYLSFFLSPYFMANLSTF